MKEPITLDCLKDLEEKLYTLRSSGKLPDLSDTETINDAILVTQTMAALKIFGITNIEVSKQ